MARAIALLALFLMASPTAAQTEPDAARSTNGAGFVPAGLWDEDRTAFYEGWFGRQLRAMGEPTLSRREDLGGFRRRFRLLVLSAFHPAYAIRIDEGTARGRVTITRLDGIGGYDPGAIDQQEHFSLDRVGMAELDREIRAAGIRSLAPDREAESGDIAVCADGLQFVFELVDREGSRLATRHKCDLTPGLEQFVILVDGLRRQVGSDLARYGGR